MSGKAFPGNEAKHACFEALLWPFVCGVHREAFCKPLVLLHNPSLMDGGSLSMLSNQKSVYPFTTSPMLVSYRGNINF